VRWSGIDEEEGEADKQFREIGMLGHTDVRQ